MLATEATRAADPCERESVPDEADNGPPRDWYDEGIKGFLGNAPRPSDAYDDALRGHRSQKCGQARDMRDIGVQAQVGAE